MVRYYGRCRSWGAYLPWAKQIWESGFASRQQSRQPGEVTGEVCLLSLAWRQMQSQRGACLGREAVLAWGHSRDVMWVWSQMLLWAFQVKTASNFRVSLWEKIWARDWHVGAHQIKQCKCEGWLFCWSSRLFTNRAKCETWLHSAIRQQQTSKWMVSFGLLASAGLFRAARGSAVTGKGHSFREEAVLLQSAPSIQGEEALQGPSARALPWLHIRLWWVGWRWQVEKQVHQVCSAKSRGFFGSAFWLFSAVEAQDSCNCREWCESGRWPSITNPASNKCTKVFNTHCRLGNFGLYQFRWKAALRSCLWNFWSRTEGQSQLQRCVGLFKASRRMASLW